MELKDWVKEHVDKQTKGKDEKGKDVIDSDKLFALADVNNLPEDKVANARKQLKAGTAGVGLISMRISNMLRGAAKKRHGLKTIAGKTVKVPGELVDGDPTHNMDGSKIVKKKAA